ncbi:unnamed protein product [Paramecium pentaurelia]|uniref:Jacalin-type lectin domain-containing protein n=1 Tax=Paramecium pentaurelia TaxID=43138 RepID=A0A8S1X4G3_9CILI|nr:unnamed protein product [Paramecium pentaurelia]
MLNKVPSQISFGIDSKESQKFDDNLQIRTGEFKISGFKIYFQDNKICGMAIIYLNKGNGRKIIFTDTYQNQKYTSLYEFDIPSNDYIQVIFGHYDEQINQLGIITYQGKQDIFGIDQGQQFNCMFMGYTFTGCNGTFTSRSIESLSFQVQKLPKDYICQNLSPLLDILYPNLDNNLIQNTELMNSKPLNLSDLTIQNKSERLDYSSKNQDQLSKSEAITIKEYKGFDFSKVPVEEKQKQQEIIYIQKTYKEGFTHRDIREIKKEVGMAIGIFKLITHHH